MGFFDFFKNKGKVEQETELPVEPVSIADSPIPEEERKYYQPDEYYVDVVHPGQVFEFHVTRFEDRKRTAIPSERGLYPAEILLLDYCTKGQFPNPKGGYQGFWWFEYGIRNVGAVLKSLEERGFIVLNSIKSSLNSLTIPQLKELLVEKGAPTKGKKADLVERAKIYLTDAELIAIGLQPKYILTDLGKVELEDNAYVPYMHRVPTKTKERSGVSLSIGLGGTIIEREEHEPIVLPHIESSIGISERGRDDTSNHFNVWSINKLLGTGDKSDWKTIVDTQEQILLKDREDSRDEFYDDLKEIDPDGYEELINQDNQIELVQKAQREYGTNHDLNAYIAFWERLWAQDGLLFEGVKWHYELAELYIKAKRYDDAINFITRILNTKDEYYRSRGESMLEQIERLKRKGK